MSNLMNSLTRLAKSPQGKKLVDRAQQIAKDPKTKEQVEKAKLKLAEMRGGGSTGGTSGSATGATTGTTGDGATGSTAGTTGDRATGATTGTTGGAPGTTPPPGPDDGPSKAP